MQTDRSQFELSPEGSLVQLLDVLQFVRKPISAGIYFIIGESVKHECIIRIRAVPNANESLF